MTLMSPDRRELIMAIPKTGGAARRSYFPKQLGWHEMKYKAQHHRLCDLDRFFGVTPSQFRKIYAIVRNPYEREISHFCHAHQSGSAQGLGKAAAMEHENVNTWLWDWRGTPLWYYERGWHVDEYGHKTDGTWDEYADIGGYRYWIMNRDGTIPNNVIIVPLDQQDKVLSAHLGRHVEVPRMNISTHGTRDEELDEHGLEAVRRIYQWSFSHIQEALNAN